MIKKSSSIQYLYCDEQLNIKGICSNNKKWRSRLKYLCSVDVVVGKEDPIPTKIVCVRNKENRKGWLAFICTGMTLSKEKIIRIYGKYCQMEFFKTCKFILNLIGEYLIWCPNARVGIVFILVMEQYKNEVQRTFGELFLFLGDEIGRHYFLQVTWHSDGYFNGKFSGKLKAQR